MLTSAWASPEYERNSMPAMDRRASTTLWAPDRSMSSAVMTVTWDGDSKASSSTRLAVTTKVRGSSAPAGTTADSRAAATAMLERERFKVSSSGLSAAADRRFSEPEGMD
jgi:hypothetical protein